MKDALGNELHEGDLVAVQLDRPLVYGRIAKIEEGGIIAGINKHGESQVRPGLVLVESRHVLNVDPRLLVAAVLALRDDTAPAPSHSLEN
jgi:hypothetical protein